MIGIIQPDTDKLADIFRARPKAGGALNERIIFDTDIRQGDNRRAIDTVRQRAQIADAFIGIQSARLFLPRRPEVHKSHGTLPYSFEVC